MSNHNGGAASPAPAAPSPSRIRAAWTETLSCLFPFSTPPQPPVAHGRVASPPQQQQQQPSQSPSPQHSQYTTPQPQQQLQSASPGGAGAGRQASALSSPPAMSMAATTYTSTNSSTSITVTAATAATLASGGTSAAAMLSANSCTSTATSSNGNNSSSHPQQSTVLTPANALELMRTYHVYVRMQKTRWRCAVLAVFLLLFYSYCTFHGRQRSAHGDGDALWGVGGGDAGSGSAGGAAGPGAAGAPGQDRLGLSAFENDLLVSDEYLSSADTRHRHTRPPWLLRVLFASGVTPGRMDLWDVEWSPPSNRTPDICDVNNERGLSVGSPSVASLSVARSQPPWSADTRRGFVALLSRMAGRVSTLLFGEDPPPYELALSAFFRTRQAMTEGSCNRCQVRAIDQEIRNERVNYRRFLRESKVRVPLLLYYNRMNLFAMVYHFRLMRVRNYQLLDYISRPDSALRRPETMANGVVNDPDLHARELSFELSRLSLIFYLQRLHLRAMRHADAMRLETFHFLRYLSSTIPTLRHIWVGQDHCSWPGVSCVVVRVPLNLLIDDDHPAVQGFVEELFSICRGPQCRQRRCVAPSCTAYTRHLTRRLFTASAPAYWMKWDRNDDTAAMDELVFPTTTARPATGVEAVAAATSAAQQQQQQQQATANTFGASRRTGQQKADGSGGATNTNPAATAAAAAAAARTSRRRTSTTRTVWTEQQFAYEHPHLVLTDPLLLVDIDTEKIMEEIVGPSTPQAAAKAADPDGPENPSHVYAEDVERPYAEDLFPMQRKLLRLNAEAAPRGLRMGKQRSDSATVTIPFTFVMINVANMGLRGYLPDFYDSSSSYDPADSAVPGAHARSTTEKPAAAASTTAEAEEEERRHAAAAAGGGERTPGSRTRTSDVRVQSPRSDVYWGRLSRQRMLEMRNLSTASQRRTATSVQSIAHDLQRVLRRVEKIGLRNHHEDLAAYFSEVSSLARYQNERWSAYRWPEAMITVTNEVAGTAQRRLYPIVEDSAFSTIFETPVQNVDYHVDVFGELNPRLIALLSIDVSANPLLSHSFPRTWLSIPFLQSVRTAGTSILSPPLRMRARMYNETLYCYPSEMVEETSPYAADGRRSHEKVLSTLDRQRVDVESITASPGGTSKESSSMGSKSKKDTGPQVSMHDRDFIGAVLLPPFKKIDAIFPTGGVEAFFQQQDPLTSHHMFYHQIQAAFDEGLVQGIKRLLLPG